MYWLNLSNLSRVMRIPEAEILTRRAIGDIQYSERTDKYNPDSILVQRTMTLGLEKFLNETEKAELYSLMKDYTSLRNKIFKKLQYGKNISNSGTERIHRILGKELGLQQIFSDSAFSEALGIYNSSQTWKIKYETQLKEDLEEINEKLLNKKHFKKGLKKVLYNKENKLKKSEALPYKPICFGKKKLDDEELYRKSKLALFVSGTSGLGNEKFGIVLGENGYRLKFNGKIFGYIKIPKSHQQTFTVSGVNRQSSRISFNEKGKLVLNITYSYIRPIKLDNISRSKGTIGIDIGPKEIAVCYVKNDGNPLKYEHYNIGGLSDARKTEKQRLLSEILEEILEQGLSFGITHVSIENLDSLKFKKTYNKQLNRMLSKFPKMIFEDLMISKCARKGFKLKHVYPAFTSVIGLNKFSNRDNLSFSHNSNSKDLSAALAIGRRGLGLKEREVVCLRKSGRTVSFTSASLFPSAENDGNKCMSVSRKLDFWYKIANEVYLFQTQTGIPKAEKHLYSTPAKLADFLEMRARERRNTFLDELKFDSSQENILPF